LRRLLHSAEDHALAETAHGRGKTTLSKASRPVEAIRHPPDRRLNIPTEELKDFVTDDEREPKIITYARDPGLDPQLVWRGKDREDADPLEVAAVPIYIQEKISPAAVIEDLRRNPPAAKPPAACIVRRLQRNRIPAAR